VVLAGGLNAANVAEAVERVRPWGVDVVTGVEASAGRKDPDALAAFIETAKDALSEFSTDPGPA
jgi:phosphoribosylanthranilate isomerase